MEKWFENKADKYKVKYNEPEIEEDYKQKKSHTNLIWGFVWLFVTLCLILFAKFEGVIIWSVPLPIWLAYKSFTAEDK